MDVTRSYTIWFSQRTGSTWFAGLLERTGVAGRPREHLNVAEPATAALVDGSLDPEALVRHVRAAGTGANGVLGIKHSFHQPVFDRLVDALVPDRRREDGDAGRLAAWEQAFPHHRHVVMTRRNQVRLAVSWWRAIQSGEWHREHGVAPVDTDLQDAYDFWAIDHLVAEATMREAGIAELLAAGGVTPLTLVYEDVVLDPQGALDRTLGHLGLDPVPLPESPQVPLADDLSEEWVQRYRRKKQKKWPHRGW